MSQVHDIVRLYLHPLERPAVPCVEKKAQIHALDRTRPLLPLRPGLPERRTGGYSRQRAVEFRAFVKGIDTALPPIPGALLVLDNYETHKTAMIHG